MIYTSTRSKLTKKQRAEREQLLQQQRAIRDDLKRLQEAKKPLSFVNPVHIRGDTSPRSGSRPDTGFAPLKQSQMYTGSKMIGIGQLHKSNAVPVFKQEEAEELAHMRR